MPTIWGTPNDDVRNGTSGNDTIYGLEGNDTLKGLGGEDTLDGGSGHDSMYGGADSDTYIVDSPFDTVHESRYDGSNDKVKSTAAYYTLSNYVEHLQLMGSADIDGTGNSLDNTIIGNSGSNVLDGKNGDDTLQGGGGDDILIGGLGADTMIGGSGSDYYYVDNEGDELTENWNGGAQDKVFSTIDFELGANIEDLELQESGGAINGTGNDLKNKISGNSSHNELYGGGNDDLLNGNGGADDMYGGSGNDLFFVENAGDNVVEYVGEGTADMVYLYGAFDYTMTANVENLIVIAAGAVNITGNDVGNQITGNSSANVLVGGAGDDFLSGGAGPDTMYGGADNDHYTVDDAGDIVIEVSGEGSDEVATSVNYTLGANLENLYLLPGAGSIEGAGNDLDNYITGNEGNNVLSGHGGNDYIDGRTGIDLMIGGAGDDTYWVYETSDQAIEAADEGNDQVHSVATYTLGANVEALTLWDQGGAINGTGNDLDNSITGNSFANTLIGGGGNDYLVGGGGPDVMKGGTGNDHYWLDQAGDSVQENANEGTDSIWASFSYTLTANFENLTLLEGVALTATGNAADNILSGNSNNNTLIGGDGNDTLNGMGGADVLNGGAGDDHYGVDDSGDQIVEGVDGGWDWVNTSLSTYTLAVNLENLYFLDSAGAATGTGNAAENILWGNSSANVLNGLGGADIMNGQGGSDTYYVDDVDDRVYEETAGDLDVVVASTSFALFWNADVEILATNSAGTTALDLTGSNIANEVSGNAGSNTIDGRGGADTLVGNGGSDTFLFTTALGPANVDSIVDFNVTDDLIGLDNAVFTSLSDGALAAGNFRVGFAGQDADDFIVYDNVGGGLYYDADGAGAGTAVKFVQLSAGLALSAADLFVL